MMNDVRSPANIKNILGRVLRDHLTLLVIVSLYVVACIVLTRVYEVKTHLIFHSCKYFLVITGLYFSIYSIYCIITFRPHRPISFIWKRFCSSDIEQRASYVIAMAAISANVTAYMYIKPLIPLLHPFVWDETFARWDAALHGTDAWRIIHPYLSHPWVMRIIVAAYVYYLAIFPVVAWQAAKRNSILRMQFLLTHVLSWSILGTIAAIIFSSAGPCFYRYVVPGPDVYSELMSFLQSPDTPASTIIQTQNSLWQFYENREYGRPFAISAMPSLHVVLAFLLVPVSRKLVTRILAIIYTILVSLGCVLLAFHYAIDVYAGILGALLIWWIVGLCLRRQFPFSGWRTQNAPR